MYTYIMEVKYMNRKKPIERGGGEERAMGNGYVQIYGVLK